jgi:hypothetical protein
VNEFLVSHGKSVCKVCPRRITFSNVLISDARRGESVALPAIVYNAETLPFLTNYRPNFRRAIAAVALVIFGMLIGRMSKRESPPIVIQRTIDSAGPGASATPVIEEKVYTCGARTRKGKPCSRRVKEPGRCWQHKG